MHVPAFSRVCCKKQNQQTTETLLKFLRFFWQNKIQFTLFYKTNTNVDLFVKVKWRKARHQNRPPVFVWLMEFSCRKALEVKTLTNASVANINVSVAWKRVWLQNTPFLRLLAWQIKVWDSFNGVKIPNCSTCHAYSYYFLWGAPDC